MPRSGSRKLRRRRKNKITVKDSYPLPLLEDCLEYLVGKRYFTILDLNNRLHQVAIEEDSIKYTAFVTPDGQFEYLPMSFGLKNAPSVFQRFINRVVQKFIDQGLYIWMISN